ncbi:MAG: OmpA family protein [Bacteroidota bacterium]
MLQNSQVALFITSDGEKGYYSNEDNRTANKKNFLYEFDVPQLSKVEYKTSFVKGRIFDQTNKEPLGANIELYDINRDQRVSFVRSDSISGEYLMVLTEGSEYALYVNKTRYLFKSLSFNYDQDINLEPIEIDIYLEPITEGATTTLKNIFFDFDKFELKEKSKTELKRVASFLNTNTDIRIEISGHTDNEGSDSYNLQLSTNRAKAVYDFLLELGANQYSLAFKGYGSSRPAFPNDSDDNRQKNRRIEFKIL